MSAFHIQSTFSAIGFSLVTLPEILLPNYLLPPGGVRWRRNPGQERGYCPCLHHIVSDPNLPCIIPTLKSMNGVPFASLQGFGDTVPQQIGDQAINCSARRCSHFDQSTSMTHRPKDTSIGEVISPPHFVSAFCFVFWLIFCGSLTTPDSSNPVWCTISMSYVTATKGPLRHRYGTHFNVSYSCRESAK